MAFRRHQKEVFSDIRRSFEVEAHRLSYVTIDSVSYYQRSPHPCIHVQTAQRQRGGRPRALVPRIIAAIEVIPKSRPMRGRQQGAWVAITLLLLMERASLLGLLLLGLLVHRLVLLSLVLFRVALLRLPLLRPLVLKLLVLGPILRLILRLVLRLPPMHTLRIILKIPHGPLETFLDLLLALAKELRAKRVRHVEVLSSFL